MSIKRKAVLSILCAALFSLLTTGHSYASTFDVYGAQSEIKVMSLSEDGADMLGLEPPNASGISYNRFTKFIVDGRNLRLFAGGINQEDRVKTKLIIIEAGEIVLKDSLELIGATADIVFLDTNSSSHSVVNCDSCGFQNFGRITLAAAVPQSVHTLDIDKVGRLETTEGGVVEINNLNASGALTVELLGERVIVNGEVNTNLRGQKDSDGNYSAVENGALVLGSGGVNIYTGGVTLDYDKLFVTSSETRDIADQTINAQITAGTISVISADPVRFTGASSLSTRSDALVTAYHQDSLIPTVEGIFLQSLGSSSSSLRLQGSLASDNKVQLTSLGGLKIEGRIDSDKVFMVVDKRAELTNSAKISAAFIDIGTNWLSNAGEISGGAVEIEAQNNIYNHFGGKIKGDSVVLSAPDATIINGARSEYAYAPSTLAALPIINDLASSIDASYTYGVYAHIIDQERGSPKRTNLGATISANTIEIEASRVENINPYRLVKPANEDWRNGVTLDTAKSRRVAIIAERQLKIIADEYIINASAVIGQNQSTDLIFQSPRVINQRYHLRAQLALFSRTLSASHPVQVGSTRHQGASGIETYLDQYSPPGVMYTFGRLMIGDGEENNSAGELINQFSFLEVFGETHLHETNLKSLGIALTGELYDNQQSIRCALYGCSATSYESYIEQETLTSFRGDVFGVRSDLEVQTVNQLEDATKRRVVDDYLADFKAQFERYELQHAVSSNVKTVEYKDYIQSWRVVPTNSGEELQIDLIQCVSYTFHQSPEPNLPNNCRSEVHTADVNALLNTYAENNDVNCLGYSGAQINSQINKYIKVRERAGTFEVRSSGRGEVELYFDGWYRNLSKGWTAHADCENMDIEYQEYFEPENQNNLSEYASRMASGHSRSIKVTVSIDDLFNGIAPATPTNFRFENLVQQNGTATYRLRWNSVAGNHISYELNGNNLGTAISRNIEVNFDGPTVRSYRVRACNNVECSDPATLTMNLDIPPDPAVYDRCSSSFYGQFRSQFSSSSDDTTHYCVIYTYQNTRYFAVTTRRFYKRGWGDNGTYDCINRRLYNRDALVSAIRNGTANNIQAERTLPAISGVEDDGVACNNWLGGHYRMTGN